MSRNPFHLAYEAGLPVSGITSLQVGSVLSYLIAFALPCLDAILPVLPSETVIIAFGVAAAESTDPRFFLLVLYAAIGAWAGTTCRT